MSEIKSICVYCGSGNGKGKEYIKGAKILGREIAKADMRLVYGGGSAGLMGAVADAVLENGGDVTGIIPQFLVDAESGHRGVSELIITKDMHERKWAMFEKSDAFVALPGGIGTLEELIEIMTWAQLDRHKKPIIIANFNGYWDNLKALLAHMDNENFIHSTQNLNPIFVDEAKDILPAILNNI